MKTIWNVFKVAGIVGGLGVWAWLGWVVLSHPSQSDTLVIPNSFSVGQVADPSAVNANFDAIKNIVNGKIDDDNWDGSGPQLACGHFLWTTGCQGAILTNSDINASAAIAYSKLNLANSIHTTDVLAGQIPAVGVLRQARIADEFTLSDCASPIGGGTWSDVPNYTWTDTYTSGGKAVIAIFIDARIASGNHIVFRINAGGNILDTTPSLSYYSTTVPIGIISLVGNVGSLSGSTIVKLQCQDDFSSSWDAVHGVVSITELVR